MDPPSTPPSTREKRKFSNENEDINGDFSTPILDYSQLDNLQRPTPMLDYSQFPPLSEHHIWHLNNACQILTCMSFHYCLQ